MDLIQVRYPKKYCEALEWMVSLYFALLSSVEGLPQPDMDPALAVMSALLVILLWKWVAYSGLRCFLCEC